MKTTSRRDFLKLAGLGVAAAALPATSTAPARRPNVVLIYTDDHDLDEIACFGGKVLTPHMDSLARDGTKFMRFYVASAVCSPSRYNALSGRYASRSVSQQAKTPVTAPANLGWEAGVYAERDQRTCLAFALREAGYATGMVGKWHQGSGAPPPKFAQDADPAAPDIRAKLEAGYAAVQQAVKECGFDYAESIYANNVGDAKPGTKHWLPKPLQIHNMEWVTAGALKFIEQNASTGSAQGQDKPFFLYMAPTLVHGPSPFNSLKSADPRATPRGYLDKLPQVQPPREDVLRRVRQAGLKLMGAGSTWLDDGVGAVLKKLDELGLAGNTLVLLAGDNGNPAKFTCYEGGALMPFVARWPGVMPVGRVCSELVSNIDFAPTILEVCGAAPLAKSDGQSFAKLLRGEPGYRRDSLMLEITTERAVVTADGFKYIAVRYTPEVLAAMKTGKQFNHWCEPMEKNTHSYDAEKKYPAYFDLDQLYDLKADPQERRNLAVDPAQAARLKAMQAQLRDYSQQLPHPFGEFKPLAAK
jgi:arylsulfatase A-like enzyme